MSPVRDSVRAKIKAAYVKYRSTVCPGPDKWYRRQYFDRLRTIMPLMAEVEKAGAILCAIRNGFSYPLDEKDV